MGGKKSIELLPDSAGFIDLQGMKCQVYFSAIWTENFKVKNFQVTC